jgi:TonB family protein
LNFGFRAKDGDREKASSTYGPGLVGASQVIRRVDSAAGGAVMHKPNGTSHRCIAIALLLLIALTAYVVSARQYQQPQQPGDERKGAGEWVRFSPEGASFSLLLPARPSGATKNDKSGMKVQTFKVKTDSTEYQVVWLTNVPQQILLQGPLNVLFPRSLEDILKSARKAGKKDLVTTHQDEITLNGCQGRESTMESASASIQAKCFIAGHDFITLAVLHPKEESAPADTKRFLDSLLLPDLKVASSPQGRATSGAGTATSPGSQDEAAIKVDTRPIPLNRPRPEYTDRARNHGVQGMVRIRALVEADGSVKDVRLVSHLPDGLDEAAIKAVRKMRFKPATKDGQPVAFWVTLEVEFNLRRGW